MCICMVIRDMPMLAALHCYVCAWCLLASAYRIWFAPGPLYAMLHPPFGGWLCVGDASASDVHV
jgi:uncharacterized membrane protein